MSWLNLHRKPFVTDANSFYNLSTGRRITKIPEHIYSLRNVRVVGTQPELMDFWLINEAKLHDASFDDNFYQLGKDLHAIIEQEYCQRGTAGSILTLPNTTDVSHLTDSQLNSLCTFSFVGCFLKAKVVEVIDGDTLDVVVYLPLLSLAQTWTRKNKTEAPILLPQPQNTGFFVRVRIRLFGLDTPEIETPDGQLARDLFAEKLSSYGNLVWVEFLKDDKYGRTLSVLYSDQRKSVLLNNFLFEESKKRGKVLANIYQGGKKAAF